MCGDTGAPKIEINLPNDLPLVWADATLAEQAIGNVVANAVMHTPPETHVQIDASIAPDTIALRVTDDGPGIPADAYRYLPQICQGHRARKIQRGRQQGTGLGLAIAKGIMEAHGGAINAESPTNGRGARFIMTFPRESGRMTAQISRSGHRR